MDGPKTVAVLRKLVFEKGADYIYPFTGPDCVNYMGNEPSCLIGHFFNELGITAAKARTMKVDGNRNARESIAVMENWPSVVKWKFTADCTEILCHAQSLQDVGSTWGQALQAAEELLASQSRYRL